MHAEEIMRLAGSVGQRASEIQEALKHVEIPGRSQPLSGVAASSVARCRQIADQIAFLSSEMASQLHTYENSVHRGRRLASMLQTAKAAGAARRKSDKKDPVEDLMESGREYLVEMEVRTGCPLINRRVAEAGLRNLQGLFLAEILRNEESIVPVKPSDKMRVGDRLIFTGLVNSIAQLQKIENLIPVDEPRLYHDLKRSGQARIIEAVISRASPVLGQTIKAGNFRARYGAVVLAVHRHGQRVQAKIGDIKLKPGDTILLLSR